jgi:hypothetical protein
VTANRYSPALTALLATLPASETMADLSLEIRAEICGPEAQRLALAFSHTDNLQLTLRREIVVLLRAAGVRVDASFYGLAERAHAARMPIEGPSIGAALGLTAEVAS